MLGRIEILIRLDKWERMEVSWALSQGVPAGCQMHFDRGDNLGGRCGLVVFSRMVAPLLAGTAWFRGALSDLYMPSLDYLMLVAAGFAKRPTLYM